jgi:YHS domain-containing protein
VIKLLVWLIFAWFIVRAVTRLLRGIANGLNGPAAPKTPAAVPLVRDPVCGTYVVAANALTSGSGSQTRFFCSENCRRAYAMKKAQ